MSPERTSTLSKVLLACSRNQISPHVYSTRNGFRVCQIQDRFYSLMDFVQTDPLDPVGCLDSIVQVTEGMHRAIEGIEHLNTPSPLAISAQRLNQVLKKHGFGHYLAYLDEACGVEAGLRRQLVHNDLHSGNFICSKSGKVFIVDFESYSENFLIGDLLFAGYRTAMRNSSLFIEFVKRYDGYHPLTDAEKRYGCLILAVDFIKKLGFILHEYEKGNSFFMKDYKKYQRFAEDTVLLARGRTKLF